MADPNSTGYDFVANTKIRSARMNSNFDFFRGSFLPIATSTWANTNSTYDLGNSSYYWNALYVNSVTVGTVTADIRKTWFYGSDAATAYIATVSGTTAGSIETVKTFVVNAGVSLAYASPSYVSIRATGSVTINGDFEVQSRGNGGAIAAAGGSVGCPDGASGGATGGGGGGGGCQGAGGAGNGGGTGGTGFNISDTSTLEAQVGTILMQMREGGGGGGGGAAAGGGGAGGAGGGVISIFAKGPIFVGSTASIGCKAAVGANGAAHGGGGGAGGCVVLASEESITNEGTAFNGGVYAPGSNGGTGATNGGGGGGGGIIFMVSPTISVGNTSVGGGTGAAVGGGNGNAGVLITISDHPGLLVGV